MRKTVYFGFTSMCSVLLTHNHNDSVRKVSIAELGDTLIIQ